MRTFALMEDVVEEGDADLISLCRPLTREPGLVNAWEAVDRRRATCISCNECLGALIAGQTLHSVQQSKEEGQPD